MTIREKFETALKMIGIDKDAIDSGHVRPNNDTDVYKIGFKEKGNTFTLSGVLNSSINMICVMVSNEADSDKHFELLKKLNELNLKYGGGFTFTECDGFVTVSNNLDSNIYDLDALAKYLANLVTVATLELIKL